MIRHLNDQLFVAINSFARATGWLHGPVLAYANDGVALFALLLFVGLLLVRTDDSRSLAAAGWACLAAPIAVAVNQPVGNAVAEARPYTTHDHLLVLATRSADFSFPSDHAVMAGAVAAGLLLVSRRLGLLVAAAALLMAFARVYIGAHYPWDVAAGLLLGAGVCMLGWAALAGPLTRLTAWLRVQAPFRYVFHQADEPYERDPVMLGGPR